MKDLPAILDGTPADWRASVETSPIRVCELLVGLGDVSVLGVSSRTDGAVSSSCHDNVWLLARRQGNRLGPPPQAVGL